MNRDRHLILQLLALGRLSPAEAERLMAAWSLKCEDAWLLPACLLMLVLPHHAPLHAVLGGVYLFCSHLPGSIGYLGQIFSQLHHLTG